MTTTPISITVVSIRRDTGDGDRGRGVLLPAPGVPASAAAGPSSWHDELPRFRSALSECPRLSLVQSESAGLETKLRLSREVSWKNSRRDLRRCEFADSTKEFRRSSASSWHAEPDVIKDVPGKPSRSWTELARFAFDGFAIKFRRSSELRGHVPEIANDFCPFSWYAELSRFLSEVTDWHPSFSESQTELVCCKFDGFANKL